MQMLLCGKLWELIIDLYNQFCDIPLNCSKKVRVNCLKSNRFLIYGVKDCYKVISGQIGRHYIASNV